MGEKENRWSWREREARVFAVLSALSQDLYQLDSQFNILHSMYFPLSWLPQYIGSTYTAMTGSPNTNLRGFNHAVHTLLKQPAQFLPHLTIPTFTHLPSDLGPHLVSNETTGMEKKRTPIIRALVLDKDNTLCVPKTTTFPPQILTKLQHLRTTPPFQNPYSILIVSNRAGSHPSFDAEVRELEAQLAHLRIPVFRLPASAQKKPFCGDEVVHWFREREVIQSPHEIAVVGDRLGTDVLMAGMMGSWSVWCKEGVFEPGETGKPERNILEKMEVWVERYLRETKGYTAPNPKGWDELAS